MEVPGLDLYGLMPRCTIPIQFYFFPVLSKLSPFIQATICWLLFNLGEVLWMAPAGECLVRIMGLDVLRSILSM
jgi:hypothetical protein